MCSVTENHDEYYAVVSLNTLLETIPETFIVEFIWNLFIWISRFDSLAAHRVIVPLHKALHVALFLPTKEQRGTFEGRFVSRGTKLPQNDYILSREESWGYLYIYMVCKGPMTREGTSNVRMCKAWMWSQNWDFRFYLLPTNVDCYRLNVYFYMCKL